MRWERVQVVYLLATMLLAWSCSGGSGPEDTPWQPPEPGPVTDQITEPITDDEEQTDLDDVPVEEDEVEDGLDEDDEPTAPLPEPDDKPLPPAHLIDTFGEVLLGGRLTPFWAQEYIGVDLAKARLADFGEANELYPVPMGLFDDGFRLDQMNSERIDPNAIINPLKEGQPGDLTKVKSEHGTFVGNLIIGDHPVGGSYNAHFAALVQFSCHDAFGYTHLFGTPCYVDLDLLNMLKPLDLRLVSASYSMEDDYGTLGHHQELVDAGVMFVQSAGNDYPREFVLTRAKHVVENILVGAMSPLGLVSFYSDAHEKVAILAPSELHILSSRFLFGSVRYEEFGGTSAAAPVVAAALSNVLAILSELTTDEAKMLMARTAMPTPTTERSDTNGAGMINALRLVEVAIRLRANGWPSDRDALIVDESIFDFAEEAAKLFEAGTTNMASSNDRTRRKGFDQIRAAVLLDPTSPARDKLHDIYTAEGYTINASFYAYTEPELSDDQLVTMIEADAAGPFAPTIARAFGDHFPDEALDGFTLAFQAKDRDQRTSITKLATLLGPDDIEPFFDVCMRDYYEDVQSSCIRNVGAEMAFSKRNERYIDLLSTDRGQSRAALYTGIEPYYLSEEQVKSFVDEGWSDRSLYIWGLSLRPRRMTSFIDGRITSVLSKWLTDFSTEFVEWLFEQVKTQMRSGVDQYARSDDLRKIHAACEDELGKRRPTP